MDQPQYSRRSDKEHLEEVTVRSIEDVKEEELNKVFRASMKGIETSVQAPFYFWNFNDKKVIMKKFPLDLNRLGAENRELYFDGILERNARFTSRTKILIAGLIDLFEILDRSNVLEWVSEDLINILYVDDEQVSLRSPRIVLGTQKIIVKKKKSAVVVGECSKVANVINKWLQRVVKVGGILSAVERDFSLNLKNEKFIANSSHPALWLPGCGWRHLFETEIDFKRLKETTHVESNYKGENWVPDSLVHRTREGGDYTNWKEQIKKDADLHYALETTEYEHSENDFLAVMNFARNSLMHAYDDRQAIQLVHNPSLHGGQLVPMSVEIFEDKLLSIFPLFFLDLHHGIKEHFRLNRYLEDYAVRSRKKKSSKDK